MIELSERESGGKGETHGPYTQRRAVPEDDGTTFRHMVSQKRALK